MAILREDIKRLTDFKDNSCQLYTKGTKIHGKNSEGKLPDEKIDCSIGYLKLNDDVKAVTPNIN